MGLWFMNGLIPQWWKRKLSILDTSEPNASKSVPFSRRICEIIHFFNHFFYCPILPILSLKLSVCENNAPVCMRPQYKLFIWTYNCLIIMCFIYLSYLKVSTWQLPPPWLTIAIASTNTIQIAKLSQVQTQVWLSIPYSQPPRIGVLTQQRYLP